MEQLHRLPDEIDMPLAALVRGMIGFEVVSELREEARKTELRRMEQRLP